MQESKIPVIVIFAPTASGKTALTKELFCEKGSHFLFKAQIISADSQAVYKGMDIGTAKPEPELRTLIPHHLIDIRTPDQQYNVSDFVDDADNLCKQIYSEGDIPVVCGGTGFYIRNFLYGIPKTPVSDEALRNKLKKIKSENICNDARLECCGLDAKCAIIIYIIGHNIISIANNKPNLSNTPKLLNQTIILYNKLPLVIS